MRVIFRQRTAMNLFTLFATSVANRILVIGRRFAVKSVVGIYCKREHEASTNGRVLWLLPLNSRANTQGTRRED